MVNEILNASREAEDVRFHGYNIRLKSDSYRYIRNFRATYQRWSISMSSFPAEHLPVEKIDRNAVRFFAAPVQLLQHEADGRKMERVRAKNSGAGGGRATEFGG